MPTGAGESRARSVGRSSITRMPAVSIRDVAARAGVTISTVSNTIHHPERVREASQAKVRAAMDELGWVPNGAARQLRVGRTGLVGFVAVDIGNPFFIDVARAAETRLREAGFSLILGSSSADPERQTEYLRLFEQQRLDGILIVGLHNAGAVVESMKDRGAPIVSIGHTRTKVPHCSVSVDDEQGGWLAAMHLLDNGAQTVTYLNDQPGWLYHELRLQGVNRALRELGRESALEIAYAGQEFEHGNYPSVGQALGSRAFDAGGDGIIASNDLVGMGVEREMARRGLRAPEDVQLLAFDGGTAAQWAPLPLTSISLHGGDLGREAAGLLLAEMTDPDHRHQHVVQQLEVIPRTTTIGTDEVTRPIL
jgi:LacI family transcriptional regulator